MCEERKLKRILFSVLIAVSWIVIAIHADKVMAATSAGDVTIQKNVSERLPTGQNGENTTVGRYGLNYTGNINVYSSPSSGNDDISYLSQTLPVWSNSSMGTLYGDNNTTKVVKAYLIWETRKRYNQYDNNANHVSFIMRDGSFTVKHIDLPFYRGTFFPPDRSVDRPLILCETFHNGKIFPAYAPD